MDDETWQELREKAEAATPGEWRVAQGRDGSNWIDAGQYDEVIAPAPVTCMAYCYGGSSQVELSDADAEFIAAANPTVVLSLLSELAAARADAQTAAREAADHLDEMQELEAERNEWCQRALERADARRALDAVRALHSVDGAWFGHSGNCSVCDVPYPCPTVVIASSPSPAGTENQG